MDMDGFSTFPSCEHIHKLMLRLSLQNICSLLMSTGWDTVVYFLCDVKTSLVRLTLTLASST